MSPALPLSTSGYPDPWVEPAVGQVDQEIDQDDGGGQDEDGGLDDWVVAVDDRLDREQADARPGEDGLDDDRPAEDVAKLEADDRDQRNQGVAQPVPTQHRKLAQALGSGGPHIVLGQHLEHARTDQAG